MFGLCYKRLQSVLDRRCSIADAVNSLNHFNCFQKVPLFSFSFTSKSLGGAEQDEKGHSFAVTYLISSCGLEPEQALSVSKKQRNLFNSPKKPDSVIKLLKDYGLNDAHISLIAKKRLQVFLYDAEKTLLPKLEFFSSIGISGTALAWMLYTNPNVLCFSLEKSLKPCYDISSTLPIPKEKLPNFFATHYGWPFKVKELSNVACNVSVLRDHNVPESSFPLWVPHYARALSFESEKVKKNVQKVISMGFSPSSSRFMKALYVISVTDASRWEQKMKFYKKWGWTEDDVLLAFRKRPLFITYNEKNVSIKLDLILNKMGHRPADVARCPAVLDHSFEKWIIPRYSVFRVLLLKGLIMREEYSFCSTVLMANKTKFLEMFIIKYQEEVPELLSIFQGKIGPAKLDLGFEESGGVKQV